MEQEIMFEDSYEDIKMNPNAAWEEYEGILCSLCYKLAFYKNFDKEILIQEAYIYFRGFCERYDPYYNGNFIPFGKYIYTNIETKLRAYIQRYYFKSKRESAIIETKVCNENTDEVMNLVDKFESNKRDDIEDKVLMMDFENILSDLPETTRNIILLRIEGLKQHEIATELNISQPYISATLKRLQNPNQQKYNKKKGLLEVSRLLNELLRD